MTSIPNSLCVINLATSETSFPYQMAWFSMGSMKFSHGSSPSVIESQRSPDKMANSLCGCPTGPDSGSFETSDRRVGGRLCRIKLPEVEDDSIVYLHSVQVDIDYMGNWDPRCLGRVWHVKFMCLPKYVLGISQSFGIQSLNPTNIIALFRFWLLSTSTMVHRGPKWRIRHKCNIIYIRLKVWLKAS